MNTTLAIIIPTFNESGRLTSTLRRLEAVIPSLGMPTELVVVDDGSDEPIEIPGRRVHLLRHCINLGQGAALQTGITYARESLRAEFYVTLDSDGQHDPKDLPALLRPLQEGRADIVFGNRFAGGLPVGIPFSRRVILALATLFEILLTGMRLKDAHNGYRAFNRQCASVISLRLNRMAHATEFKQIVARHRLRYAEVPVTISYSQETLAKGQTHLGGPVILKDLLSQYLFER